MFRPLVFLAIGGLALLPVFVSATAGPGIGPTEPFRVLSYNIRYGSAADGPDRWENRRDKVIETIRDLDAGIVGLQEAEIAQIRELLAALPRYAAAGVGRDDARIGGEASPILYDRTRFTLAETETFWLSETPGEPGSISWRAACPRVATRVRLVDLESGAGLHVYNTHWDHISQRARAESARIIREHIARLDGGLDSPDPVVVMGDLNAAEDNEAFLALLDGPPGPALRDTYRVVDPESDAGTFTGFRVDSDGGTRKIDHVLAGPGLEVLDAGIDRRKIDGRYPSDHFPVWADLQP
jgi:endonuclease/exonuclease/phosphatase family metal-dependent hydrolase